MTAEDALQQLIPLCRLWGAEVESPESIVKAVTSHCAYHDKHEKELYDFQVPLLAQVDRMKNQLQTSQEALGWVVGRIDDVLDAPIYSEDGTGSLTLGSISKDTEAYALMFSVGTMKKIKAAHTAK
jgi:hypothetical protein